MPVDVDEAFAFFADARNLEAITPQWLRFRILEAPPKLERGSLLVYRLRLFGLPIRWRTEIAEWRPPHGFVDVQLEGPYRRWEHTHRLRRVDGGTEISDRVVYRLPFEPLSGLLAPVTVRRYNAASAPCVANMPARLSPGESASRGGGPPGKPFMCRSPLAASATEA